MIKKLTVGSLSFCVLLSPAGLALADTDESRLQLGLSWSLVELDRSDNDFISSSEADSWGVPNLQFTWVRDLPGDSKLAIKGDLGKYSTSGVALGEVEDDSPMEHRAARVSLLRDVDAEAAVAFGLNYVGVTTTQTETESTKDAYGIDFGYARSLEQWGYSIRAGAILDGTEEAQDALIRAQYFGVTGEYAFNEKFRVGVEHSYLTGDEFDEDERKSDQRLSVVALYGVADVGRHTFTAGLRQQDWKREDVDGSNIGEIQAASGSGLFITYEMPFGSKLSRNEKLLLNRGPDVTEFVMVGGSVMD